MAKHVLIDARALENRVDGIGQYTLNIINNLHLLKEYKFSVIILDNLLVELNSNNINYIKTSVKRYSLKEFFFLRKTVSIIKPDIFFSTSPYLYPFIGCKGFFTLHDLFNVEFPGYFRDINFVKAFFSRIFFRFFTFISIKSASMIITDSEYSKRKIILYYNLPNDKVFVAKLAINPIYRTSVSNYDVNKFREKYNLPSRFILHVGNFRPNKNIDNTLIVFSEYLKSTKDFSLKLIFTTKNGRGFKHVISKVNKLSLEKNIEMRDYFKLDDMPLLYRASLGLFFPSLDEGFGLPVLEAMSCGVPVVTSQNISTEEVANGHAYLVDPVKIESMLEGMKTLVDYEKTSKQFNSGQNYSLSQTWDTVVNNLFITICELK